MSFAAYAQDPIQRLVVSASEAPKLSLLVGAGASMEAGLPSWNALVERLLVRAAEDAQLLPAGDAEARKLWLEDAGRDGPLGAAAMVDALAGERRDEWVPDALYGASGPASFYPGPIARQIAALQRSFGDRLRLMTLNYDDLLEEALRTADLQPLTLATAEHRLPGAQVPVFHLHGYHGRDGPAGQLVLSEADYHGMQLGTAWQDDLMRNALRDSTLLFVGTSLVDPNMLRYLHAVSGEAGGEHFAVFVRQGVYPAHVPSGLAEARERGLTRRWEQVGVVPVFVDHYTDVAQVLAEVALRRADPEAYRPLPERAAEWVDTVTERLIAPQDREVFVRSQGLVSAVLRDALDAAVSTASELAGEGWDETLALSLWLCDRDGRSMTSWYTTDRLHLDPATIEPLPVDEHSGWVAIRAYCQGTPLAEAHTPDGSRWRFVRGTPLTLHSERYGRLPIGCLTAASLAPKEETQLHRMPRRVAAAFSATLADAVRTILEQPFDA
jgi:hypothetical protein